MDRMAYLEQRRRNLAQAGQPTGDSGETLPGQGWGEHHVFSAPEATMRAAETAAGAHTAAAESQAGAYRYGADKRLEEAAVPRTSHSYQYDLTPEPVPGWDDERAKGGPVAGKLPYLVGEKGPELMVPEQNGKIIPNHQLQMLARRAIPRCSGGLVRAIPRVAGGDVYARGGPQAPPPGTKWVSRQGLHNAAEANRTGVLARIEEDKLRAAAEKDRLSPERLAVDTAREAIETARFKTQANAMYPGADGKVDPRAKQLIDLYTGMGMHTWAPQSAMDAIEQGMKIHKVVDSWADGKKLAQIQDRLAPEAVAAIKAGNPTAILAAEQRGFGNEHGLNPEVLFGKAPVKGLSERIGTTRAPAPTLAPTPTPAPVAPTAPVPAGLPVAAAAEVDPALANWRTAGNVVKAVGEAPGNLIEAGLIRPINRAAQGLGSLAVQAARQVIPGAYKVFNEPTPANPYGLEAAAGPSPLAIPVGPGPVPLEEPAPNFYQ